jgi:dihydroneopterin aldolase
MERMSAAPQQHPDTISIKGLQLPCFIGVPDEERASQQTLLADISLSLTHPLSRLHDHIDDTVDYDALSQQLVQEAQHHPRQLIETLADDLAQRCLSHPKVAQASITIRKFILPNTEHVAVTLTRNK